MLVEQWKQFLSFWEVRLGLGIMACGLLLVIYTVGFFKYPECNGWNAGATWTPVPIINKTGEPEQLTWKNLGFTKAGDEIENTVPQER